MEFLEAFAESKRIRRPCHVEGGFITERSDTIIVWCNNEHVDKENDAQPWQSSVEDIIADDWTTADAKPKPEKFMYVSSDITYNGEVLYRKIEVNE